MSESSKPLCKKYRSELYDEYDIKYAIKLYESFQNVNNNLQKQFNKFTENLMDDKQISRYKLLDAIDNFQKSEKYKNICENDNSYYWISFQELAFNYRPYQP